MIKKPSQLCFDFVFDVMKKCLNYYLVLNRLRCLMFNKINWKHAFVLLSCRAWTLNGSRINCRFISTFERHSDGFWFETITEFYMYVFTVTVIICTYLWVYYIIVLIIISVYLHLLQKRCLTKTYIFLHIFCELNL